MLSIRGVLSWVLVFVVAASLPAQAWGPELQKEDIGLLDAKLAALGTSYRAEPLLAAYLAFGRNPDFVETLLRKGCNPNKKAPGVALSALSSAVTRNLNPRITALLVQAGAALEAQVPGFSGTVIDIALDRQEYETAGWLVKANQRALPRERLVLSARYKDDAPFLVDDLVSVRNVLRYGDLDNLLVWNLSLAGNSRKVLNYLIELQVDGRLNDPGSPDENTVGLGLLASNVELLGALLAEGLTAGQVDFDKLYLIAFSHRDLGSVRGLKALDPAPRPPLYRAALAAGPEFLKAVTANFDELAKPEFLQSADGPGLLTDLYEQAGFTAVAPLLQAAPSDSLVAGFYRYALAKKDLGLIKSLVAFEAPKVRPELYPAAADAGLEPLKALTHDLADLKNPALFQDANQNGREKLTALLLKNLSGGRTLLERIFEKSDLATVLALVGPLDPPPELLTGKEFSAAYQRWLNRANKDIVKFGFLPDIRGTVQGTLIAVTVPASTDPKALVAVFTLSGGAAAVAGVPQVSGTTPNDFSAPVVYEVTAQDGSKKTYTVTVTVAAPPPVPPADPASGG